MTSLQSLALNSLFGLLCGGALPSWAQCEGPSPWVVVWPECETCVIQPRQQFLFATGEPLLLTEIRQMGRDTEVYLWSAHDSVSLRVADQLVTEDGSAQLLLVPDRPLVPDGLYELRAERAGKNLFSLFKNTGKGSATRYRWRVAALPDTQPPRWVATPAVVKTKYAANSEGLDNYVLFSNPLQDSSACLIKTIIRHVLSGQQVAFYLFPWQNRLPIGWFTCGGNIRFRSEETYTASFEAIDANGNRASATGTDIPFRAPRKVSCCWGND